MKITQLGKKILNRKNSGGGGVGTDTSKSVPGS